MLPFRLMTLVLLVLLGSNYAYGQTPTGPPPPTGAKAARLDSLFSAHLARGEFNGNVLIAEGGRVILKKSYGRAQQNPDVPLNTDTRFDLASVSKAFTAMGIVQLKREGKLAYTDPVAKYIPELKKYRGVSVGDLVHHTGGLPDYMEVMRTHWDKSKIATNDDVIRMFQAKRPKREFKPGKQYSYSNTGYLLLATVIERVSGQSYGEYLNRKIFEPLSMTRTQVYRSAYDPARIDNRADGHEYSSELKRDATPAELGPDNDYIYLDGIVGDGMVNSTLEDLFKWDRALYDNDFISAEDRSTIFAPSATKSGEEVAYGFGWQLREDERYGKRSYHSGRWAGFIAWFERHMDQDKTIIILTNYDGRVSTLATGNVRRILYDRPLPRAFELPEAELKRFTGTYLNEDGEAEKIVYELGRLWSNGDYELKPLADKRFAVVGFRPQVIYTFDVGEDGRVSSVRIKQEGTGVDRLKTRKPD